jgi:hypothetical protein
MGMAWRDSLTLYKSLGLDDPAHGVMTCGGFVSIGGVGKTRQRRRPALAPKEQRCSEIWKLREWEKELYRGRGKGSCISVLRLLDPV